MSNPTSLIIPPLGAIAKEFVLRTVRIYSPAATVTQSGQYAGQKWKIDFDTHQKWENPLMGWTSSADPNQALSISFKTKESAIRFAENRGWAYYVQEKKEPRWMKKNYGENFAYVSGKLRFYKTK